MKITVLLLFLSAQIIFSQNKLAVDDVAPEIKITNYIQNGIDESDWKGKFIVLEFWATWCGPCIAEVPKLNKLKEKFESQNLTFISITDENVKKVEKTLKNIPFKSIVVSDTTGTTLKNFIAADDGSYSIPATFLIDNKGIIKWIGSPDILNDTIIHQFLNSEPIEKTIIESNISVQTVLNTQPTPVESIFSILSDEKVGYIFSLIDGDPQGFKGNINMIEQQGIYFDVNNNLKSIFVNLLDVPQNLVKVNHDSITSYSVIFKNAYLKDVTKSKKEIKQSILKALNLREYIDLVKYDIYNLTTDKSLIIFNEKSIENPTIQKVATDVFCYDITLKDLYKWISANYDLLIENVDDDQKTFDLNFENKNLEGMIQSLSKSGIILKKEKRDMSRYTFK